MQLTQCNFCIFKVMGSVNNEYIYIIYIYIHIYMHIYILHTNICICIYIIYKYTIYYQSDSGTDMDQDHVYQASTICLGLCNSARSYVGLLETHCHPISFIITVGY